MRRNTVLHDEFETELLEPNATEIEWPTDLETEMSEYDTYLLMLDDSGENDYLSSYCSIQRPEYHKVH